LPFLLQQQNALLERPAVVAVIGELQRLMEVLQEPCRLDAEEAASKARSVAETKAAEGMQETLARAREEGAARAAAAAAAAAEAAAARKPITPTKTDAEWEQEREEAIAKTRAKALNEAHSQRKSEVRTATRKAAREATDSIVDLLYFAMVFDHLSPWGYSERSVALAHAAAVATSPETAITPQDLELIAMTGRTLVTRPMGAVFSHADALRRCKEVAMQLVSEPDAPLAIPMHPVMASTSITARQLLHKLAVLKGTEYFTGIPGTTSVPGLTIVPGPPMAPPPPAAPTQGPTPGVALATPGLPPTTSAATARSRSSPEEAAAAAPAAAMYVVGVEQHMTPAVNVAAVPGAQYPLPQQQQQQQPAVPPGSASGVPRGPGFESHMVSPPSFAGDSELGIEETGTLERQSTRDDEATSDMASKSGGAPTPTTTAAETRSAQQKKAPQEQQQEPQQRAAVPESKAENHVPQQQQQQQEDQHRQQAAQPVTAKEKPSFAAAARAHVVPSPEQSTAGIAAPTSKEASLPNGRDGQRPRGSSGRGGSRQQQRGLPRSFNAGEGAAGYADRRSGPGGGTGDGSNVPQHRGERYGRGARGDGPRGRNRGGRGPARAPQPVAGA
jgi:hypothetical protein